MFVQSLALALILGFAGLSADACSPHFKTIFQNKSVKHAKDCSFTGGGRHDFFAGDAANDQGNGRVVQIVADFADESAIVTDCRSAEQIQVFGLWDEADSAACEGAMQVRRYLQPKGRLSLSVGATISDLSKDATHKGFKVKTSAFFNDAGAKRRDYPDLFCGCKLYYPDSAGAKS